MADEPVSALDVSIARQVTDLMLDLQQREGISFLFISHDIAVIERVSHRIAVMHAGEIVETGPARKRGTSAPIPATAPSRSGSILQEAAPGHFVREYTA